MWDLLLRSVVAMYLCFFLLGFYPAAWVARVPTQWSVLGTLHVHMRASYSFDILAVAQSSFICLFVTCRTSGAAELYPKTVAIWRILACSASLTVFMWAASAYGRAGFSNWYYPCKS